MVLDVKSFHVRVCYKTVVMTTFGAINEESNKPVMLLQVFDKFSTILARNVSLAVTASLVADNLSSRHELFATNVAGNVVGDSWNWFTRVVLKTSILLWVNFDTYLGKSIQQLIHDDGSQTFLLFSSLQVLIWWLDFAIMSKLLFILHQ